MHGRTPKSKATWSAGSDRPAIGRGKRPETTEAGSSLHRPCAPVDQSDPPMSSANPTAEQTMEAPRRVPDNSKLLVSYLTEIEQLLGRLGDMAQLALIAVARDNGIDQDTCDAPWASSEVVFRDTGSGSYAIPDIRDSATETAARAPAMASCHEDMGEGWVHPRSQSRPRGGLGDAISPSPVPPCPAEARGLTDPRSQREAGARSRSPLAGLTPRQSEVLLHIRQGKSNRDIANSLGLSKATVAVHVTGILRALGVKSRTQAVLVAIGATSRASMTR